MASYIIICVNKAHMSKKRVQMLPTTKDEDRLAKSLKEQVPDRVYILYNKDPIAMHDGLNEDVTKNVEGIVQDYTLCYDRDEVFKTGIDFYRFNEALVEVYKLIYKESKRGNEVLVNVSGGTKPVAIALTFACSLVDNGEPIYYVAEKYPNSHSQTETDSQGVVDTPFEIGPLQGLDLSDILPDKTEEKKIRLILQLLEADAPSGTAELLSQAGVIAPEKPEDEKEASNRRSILQSHYPKARSLKEDKIASKGDDGYTLTNSGELIARLIKAREEAEQELVEE
ncbi:DUF6293 family protein [Haloarcula laminariae]|uniref:HFX_2341 family transcriptional regulator domain-containing protein n=1 Tax=Haloarcula laminariae TaxID=2961577 RepID=UPI0021C5C31D|nr:DUF6293 family protein [Halomicroarcula laminariae]